MIEHLAHIDANSRQIADLAASSDLSLAVPTCGDWTLADLTWHLGEVQHFWSHIIEQRATTPKGYEEPVRPTDDELAPFLAAMTERLVAALAAADPAEPCWSWSRDQTVGFTHRRQAHEALIHRVDAELAVGRPSTVDADLAADGVDELLVVFMNNLPSWASFSPSHQPIELSTTDRDASWVVRLGRMSGTSPDTGQTYDDDAIALDPDAVAAAEISGPAAALDLWLWGRAGSDDVRISGDATLAGRLRAAAVDATQ